MFEKFTQKAIDVIQAGQNYASDFGHKRVLACHILLGLVNQTKGVQAKILNFDKIHFEKLANMVKLQLPQETNEAKDKNIIFSLEARNILKYAVDLTLELNSKFTMPQHIALAILSNKELSSYKMLKSFGIDEKKIIPNLKRMLDKRDDIKVFHPETEIENSNFTDINTLFKEHVMSEILKNAQSKVTTSGYEIIGTEQIMQSILDNPNYKVVELLNKYSINSEIFAQKLSEIPSRSAEFENSQKQIIFTPNAFLSLIAAFDYAKESGSVEIAPEHLIYGISKSKKGIAYKILSELLPKSIDFEDEIIKKLNDSLPETLAILRLAKAEALSLDCPVVGSEMILLGILSYSTGVAYNTLKRLGITLKDARDEVIHLVKPERNVNNLSYSLRARRILELAYETAQEHKRSKIKSENLLYGITKVPNCLAMQVLSNLGTDVLELQQGIKQELLGGMDL